MSKESINNTPKPETQQQQQQQIIIIIKREERRRQQPGEVKTNGTAAKWAGDTGWGN